MSDAGGRTPGTRGSDRPAPRRARRAATGAASSEVQGDLPRSADDTDLGWGEGAERPGEDDDRHLRERPPHW